MFSPAEDPYDVPPAWWEMDCVRYGISYNTVRSRLASVMGSHVVRLTDREYMMRLASRLQENYEARQRTRIEQRKLRVTSVVPELRKLVPKSLSRVARRRRQCAPKFDADAAKECKKLAQKLFLNDLHAGIKKSSSFTFISMREKLELNPMEM
ncbi:hypothetical protein PUN28_016436 [Cardiocondyla obscurior]|uniref:Uncharacterized protein n=1 Tax=Cardiocondyla obscurior TaxID=286306 RepID=A0AAW2ERB6_9HYME